MSKECITNQEKVLIFTWKSTFMDDEITFSFIALVKVLLWVNLKHVVAHLEPNWFDLRGNLLAWLLDIAESLV
jgi:uncharacterized membrane protein YesL